MIQRKPVSRSPAPIMRVPLEIGSVGDRQAGGLPGPDAWKRARPWFRWCDYLSQRETEALVSLTGTPGDGQGTEVPALETSAVLASAEDRVVGEAVAALERRHLAHQQASSPEERRRYLRDLFGLVVRCAQEGDAEPIIASSGQFAADRFADGFEIAESQGIFNVLQEVLWSHVASTFAGDQRIEALRLVNAILGAGKDALARTYVALASRERGHLGEQPAAPREGGEAATGGSRAGAAGLAGAAVKTGIRGHVGVITLDDQRRRNALSAQMANGITAAFGSLRADGVRAVVLRAAAGMHVWSAGQDINELPRGRVTRSPTTTRLNSCSAPSAASPLRSLPWCTGRCGAGRSTWCSAVIW